MSQEEVDAALRQVNRYNTANVAHLALEILHRRYVRWDDGNRVKRSCGADASGCLVDGVAWVSSPEIGNVMHEGAHSVFYAAGIRASSKMHEAAALAVAYFTRMHNQPFMDDFGLQTIVADIRASYNSMYLRGEQAELIIDALEALRPQLPDSTVNGIARAMAHVASVFG